MSYDFDDGPRDLNIQYVAKKHAFNDLEVIDTLIAVAAILLTPTEFTLDELLKEMHDLCGEEELFDDTAAINVINNSGHMLKKHKNNKYSLK